MLLKIQKETVATKSPTNYVVCVDVSGSMYGVLPKLRESLKNKLTSLIEANDTLSIIWFSGKGEAGFVFEDYKITDVRALEQVKKGIDRYLTAQCLTAFDLPIELASKKVNPNMVNSFLFLSDGYNNASTKANVLKAASGLSVFDSATWVEMGLYCDTKLLTELAELTGGVLTNANGFENIELTIINSLRGVIEQRLPVPAKSDSVICFDGESISICPVGVDGVALVSSNALFVSDWKASGDTFESIMIAYAAAMQGNWDLVEDMVFSVGDATLIETLGAAYSKVKIEEFKTSLLDALTGKTPIVPQIGLSIDPNRFCVLDLLELLSNTDGCYFYPSLMDYQRIGVAKTVKVAENAKAGLEAASFLGITAPIKLPHFVATNPKAGVPLSKLNFNVERANVSILATTDGKVVDLPSNSFGVDEWETKIHRNFTVIKDGNTNLPLLPVTAPVAVLYQIPLEAIEATDGQVTYINLNKLPVVNRKRINELNSAEAVKVAFARLKVQAALKVLKYYDGATTTVKGIDPALSEFLKEQGITEQGYAPKVESNPSGDFYIAPSLKFKFAGASSLPSVEKVIEKQTKIAEAILNKAKKIPTLNLAEELMVNALAVVGAVKPEDVSQFRINVNKQKRDLDTQLALITNSLILSRKWFKDKKDFEDNVVAVNELIACKIVLEDVQEKL